MTDRSKNEPSASDEAEIGTSDEHLESLSESLKSLGSSRDMSQGITIGELFDSFGTKGFGILLALLALPSALPVPAPGYSTPFGILLAALGFQLLMGRREPALPNWARSRSLPGFIATAMVTKGAGIARFIEKLLHPRLVWAQGPTMFRFLSLVIIIMGALMILPIPLTNTAPAFVILVIAVGMIERDGLFLIGSVLLSFAALILYVFVIYVVVRVIMETGFDLEAINLKVDEMKDGVKDFIKGLPGRD